MARAVAQSVAPDRFEAAVRVFEREVLVQGGIVFAGSSTVRLWRSLASDLPGLPVLRRGFGGATVADVSRYGRRIIVPCRPRVVVLLVGGNDLADGLEPQDVADAYRLLVEELHQDLPEAQIGIVSVNPTAARTHLQRAVVEINELLRALAVERPFLTFIDSASSMLDEDGLVRRDLLRWDGLHLNPAGYRVLASVVRPAVERAWEQTARS